MAAADVPAASTRRAGVSFRDVDRAFPSANDAHAAHAPAAPAPAAPAVSLEQLKANVSSAYSNLKQALTGGDRDQIQKATDAYKAAQTSYESAKTNQ